MSDWNPPADGYNEDVSKAFLENELSLQLRPVTLAAKIRNDKTNTWAALERTRTTSCQVEGRDCLLADRPKCPGSARDGEPRNMLLPTLRWNIQQPTLHADPPPRIVARRFAAAARRQRAEVPLRQRHMSARRLCHQCAASGAVALAKFISHHDAGKEVASKALKESGGRAEGREPVP